MQFVSTVLLLALFVGGKTIAAEPADINYETSPAVNLGPEKGVMRRDPSDIIKVGEPKKPERDHLILAPRNKRNVGLRKDNWVYIGAQGDGGKGLGNRGGPQAVAH